MGVSTCGVKIAFKHSESSFPVEAISCKLDFSIFCCGCDFLRNPFFNLCRRCDFLRNPLFDFCRGCDFLRNPLCYFCRRCDFLRNLLSDICRGCDFLQTQLFLSWTRLFDFVSACPAGAERTGHNIRHSNIFVSSDSIPAYSNLHCSKSDVCRLEFSCFWIRRSNFVPACPTSAKRAET